MLQRFILLVCGTDHVRVTMPDADRHDSAERVEISFTFFVPDVLHFAFDEHERLFVVEKNSRVQKSFAQMQNFIGRWAVVFFRLVIKWRKLGSFHVDFFQKCARAGKQQMQSSPTRIRISFPTASLFQN